jgi:hypothetical protein
VDPARIAPARCRQPSRSHAKGLRQLRSCAVCRSCCRARGGCALRPRRRSSPRGWNRVRTTAATGWEARAETAVRVAHPWFACPHFDHSAAARLRPFASFVRFSDCALPLGASHRASARIAQRPEPDRAQPRVRRLTTICRSAHPRAVRSPTPLNMEDSAPSDHPCIRVLLR